MDSHLNHEQHHHKALKEVLVVRPFRPYNLITKTQLNNRERIQHKGMELMVDRVKMAITGLETHLIYIPG